jgi:hypothetical protein
MKVIETVLDFKIFLKDYELQSSILIPVFCDSRLHPAQNRLCLLGVYGVETKELVVLPFNHPEAANLPYKLIEELSKGLEIWTPDKKVLGFLPIEDQGHIEDVQALDYVVNGTALTRSHEFYSSIINHTHERHYNDADANCAVPLYKWAEFLLSYSEDLLAIIEANENVTFEKGYSFLVGIALPALRWVESNGLHVDYEILKEHFGSKAEKFVMDDTVYSEYNLFTAAGRPSCRFGGINFAALHKDDGQRTAFTSRFDDGMMVLLDFESYHVRLIANHLGYQLPSTPAHEYFGQQYFGTTNLTDEQYAESKVKTFHNLYSDTDTDIPFFKKVQDFKARLWEEIQKQGYVESPLTKKRIRLSHIWQPNRSKVFNYYVQFMETEQNLSLLSALTDLFDGSQSKIVLYNYDSFLIDFCLSDGKELILEMVQFLEQGKKFPIRIKYGKNFGEMKPLTLSGRK